MTIIENKSFDAERIFYASKELTIRRCSFDGFADGESAFKECQDISAENSFFNLRYPFWHGENITVRNSVIKGEYLAWYSDGLTLEHCRIIGTQPFCYCKKLNLWIVRWLTPTLHLKNQM